MLLLNPLAFEKDLSYVFLFFLKLASVVWKLTQCLKIYHRRLFMSTLLLIPNVQYLNITAHLCQHKKNNYFSRR